MSEPTYPNFPGDPAALAEARQRIAAIPRGLDFFDMLERDPVLVAVYKTDIVRGALERNAQMPPHERRAERAIIDHEEWVFESYAGI